MPAPVVDAALEAELEAEFGLTFDQVVDLEKLPLEQRGPIVDGWRELGKLSWVQSPSAFDRFVTILNALVAIANPIGAISGGVTGVAGAIAAIKGI